MPDYTVTIRWKNPASGQFEPVTVRGYLQGGSLVSLVYRDVFYQSSLDAPEPPIINSVFFSAQDSATIEWQLGWNTPNAISFDIFRDGVLQATVPGTQRSYTQTVPTGTPNPTFIYTMRLTSDAGTSDLSAPWNAQYNGPTNEKPPSPPTQLVVSNITDTSADLTWLESTDSTVQGHRIFRNGNIQLVGTPPLDADSRSYTLTGLTEQTTYTNVNVKRYNAFGQSLGSNNVTFTTARGGGGGVSRFPGHLADLIYLGLSTDQTFDSRDTLIGTTAALGRISDSGLTTGTVTQRVAAYFAKMNEVLIDGKMPWLSITPTDLGLTGTTTAMWNTIAAGGANAALEQYFDMISELPTNNFCMLTVSPKPVLADATAASAFCSMTAFVGARWATYNSKANGIYGPILDEEHFGQILAGTRAASQLVNNTIGANAEFLGFDIFQDTRSAPAGQCSTRMNYIIGQYATTNFADIMFAVSDFGGSNVFRQGGTYKTSTVPADGSKPTGSQWESEALSHFFGNLDRYFAVSQRDATATLNGAYWALDEAPVLTGPGILDSAPTSKMNVFRGYLNGTKIARQQGGDVTRVPQVTATLNKSTFNVGEQMTLTLTENITVKRTFVITDTSTTWNLVSDNGTTLVYRANASSTAGAKSVRTVMTRTYDGATATATVNYTVQGVTSSPFLMGTSLPDSGKATTYLPLYGGYDQWDAVRCYDPNDVNRLLNFNPKAIGLSGLGGLAGGAGHAADLRTFLIAFYEGGSGYSFGNMPLAQRQQVEIHYANGNEYGKNVDSSNLAGFVDTNQRLYNVTHELKGDGTRRFPLASSWLDPTQNQELRTLKNGDSGAGSVPLTQSLHQSAPYLDGVAWSFYPPGRETPTSDNPTYSMPTFLESDADNLHKGFLIRCYTRTRSASQAAGKGSNGLWIACWEVGIGRDPNSPGHRPWYVVHQLAGGMQKLNTQFNFTMKTCLYWNQQVADVGGVPQSQNVFSDEPGTTNPSTATAWRNWRSLNHEFGGTHPAQWSGFPQSGWQISGGTLA